MYIGENLLNRTLLYIIFSLFLISCKTVEIVESNPEEIIEVDELHEVKEIIPEKITPIPVDEIQSLIDSMSLEEKIGQLFMLEIRGNTVINSELELIIKKYKPGGIILFSNNIINNNQIESLITGLQNTSDIPLFISVDEEGGLVSRLGKPKEVDVTYLPPALTIGNTGDERLAYNAGQILGRELSSLGFNMDMAPIADVNTNPQNPVIGNRTFSEKPEVAAKMVVEFMDGMEKYGVIPVLKHFPGHGDTSSDSHLGTVVSPHSLERLEQIEFIPFIAGINNDAKVIMTAHIMMPGISSLPLPSTLNHDIITGILREKLKFNGVIITDAMDMGAITLNFNSKESALLGIEAGVDMLLIPNNLSEAYNGLLNAVKNNQIKENRINESLYRILHLKSISGILNNKNKHENIIDVKNDPDHQNLISTIKELRIKP